MKTPFQFKICDMDDHVLKVKVEGHANKNNIVDMYEAIHGKALSAKRSKVLMDATNMAFDYPMTDFIPLVNSIKHLVKDLKVARVCEPYEQRQEIIQSYSDKENLPLRNFNNCEEAKAWLHD
jgi:hypothetical protein